MTDFHRRPVSLRCQLVHELGNHTHKRAIAGDLWEDILGNIPIALSLPLCLAAILGDIVDDSVSRCARGNIVLFQSSESQGAVKIVHRCIVSGSIEDEILKVELASDDSIFMSSMREIETTSLILRETTTFQPLATETVAISAMMALSPIDDL